MTIFTRFCRTVFIVLLTLTFAVPSVLAQVVDIPDANLRAKIEASLSKDPGDTITAEEMLRIEEFTAQAAGIESLIGLEYATNLRNLYLGNVYSQDWEVIFDEGESQYKVTKPETPNKISDLAPLENLTNLIGLDLSCNAVSNLYPLRNLTNLKRLKIGENRITSVDLLADLINLEYLYLNNYFYSPQWAGNNEIKDLTPLLNLINLKRLDVEHNPIGSSIDIVRNFPKLKALNISCCGVSNLRSLVECPGLRGTGSWVYMVYSPLVEGDLQSGIKALRDRGVNVTDGTGYIEDREGKEVFTNYVELCSVSFRESFRAAPALQFQLGTEPDELSSLWHDLSQVPEDTSLLPNYPNPFNPETWIPYQLATPAEVRVAIHAADGRLVRTLALGYQTAGVYKSKGRAAYWDGRNAQGEPVASGVYFYTLMASDFTATRKLLIRK